jgi:hypothetical protein
MCDLSQQRVNADLYELDLMMCGNMAFAVSYQKQILGTGISLHIFESSSTYREIIRFDCFEAAPHYHLNYSDYDYPSIQIPKKSIEASFSWSCEFLLENTEELLVKSKAKKLLKGVDLVAMEKVLGDMSKIAHELIKEYSLT